MGLLHFREKINVTMPPAGFIFKQNPQKLPQRNKEEENMSKPDPIDMYVGSRLKMRRIFLGMSQTKVGNALGLTFQQIQKYERGANRIGSSRLFKLSNLLDIPVGYFFEETPDQVERHARSFRGGNPEMFDQDRFSRHETLEFVRNYYMIKNPNVRKRIFELIKGIARVGK